MIKTRWWPARLTTALAQFMHPLPGEKEFCQFLIELLGQPKNLKGTALERLIEFIRREMPKNKPYDHLYARQVAALRRR